MDVESLKMSGPSAVGDEKSDPSWVTERLNEQDRVNAFRLSVYDRESVFCTNVADKSFLQLSRQLDEYRIQRSGSGSPVLLSHSPSMSFTLARYESFLVNNVSTISSVESTLRSITWLLPGRFKDAELASEALSAALNCMSLYHDTLLAKIIDTEPKHRPLIPPSLHTRYTRAWADNSLRYRWAARVLELTSFLELLIEMGLRRKVSDKNRWRGIVILEAIKYVPSTLHYSKSRSQLLVAFLTFRAILRLTILRVTRRPTLSPPIPERDIDPANLPPVASNASSPTLAPSSPSSSSPTTPEHLRNNHIPLPPHPLLASPAPPTTRQTSGAEDYLLSKALTTSSVKTPTALIKPLVSPKDWLAEGIYILRPLIYVMLLSNDCRTNRPLFTSLILELVSRHLRRVPSNSSALERQEYARRDRDLFWPKLEAFADGTANIPIFNLLGGFLKDWVPLIDEYYYSGACSRSGFVEHERAVLSPSPITVVRISVMYPHLSYSSLLLAFFVLANHLPLDPMPEQATAPPPPDVRRIVTTHNPQGVVIVKSDTTIPSTPILSPNIRAGDLWKTDATPTNDNNDDIDGATRKVPGFMGLVMPRGTTFRFTDLGPGEVVGMHRSSSVDYNVLIQGELVLIMDNGAETYLKNPGDVIVQRGTVHGWRNPGTAWTRWACVVVDAEPASVGGTVLEPMWGGPAIESEEK
ncbi:hypothetical protein EW146_g1499 [Bondarzewia mesenterica]|uniref:Uncharacterized protein n=1 Tax=Bondarzewia mesenterica TaxID=1095465 RepID=A0A4S4M5Z8_9AGAM|nr:hypothetical protein EW146_g1499 [Bondarzewia mesenterica]